MVSLWEISNNPYDWLPKILSIFLTSIFVSSKPYTGSTKRSYISSRVTSFLILNKIPSLLPPKIDCQAFTTGKLFEVVYPAT